MQILYKITKSGDKFSKNGNFSLRAAEWFLYTTSERYFMENGIASKVTRPCTVGKALLIWVNIWETSKSIFLARPGYVRVIDGHTLM